MSDHKVYNTPLLKKIGVKEYQVILLYDSPDDIKSLLDEGSFAFHIREKENISYDLIWTFVNSVNQMEVQLKKFKKMIVPNGMIWVSWYKKSSKLSCELNENLIRDTALALGLVDIKVASVDTAWSALKLVIPVVKREND